MRIRQPATIMLTLLSVCASAVICQAQESRNATDSTGLQSTAVVFPPHKPDRSHIHVITFDIPKVFIFQPFIYNRALNDHVVVGGAIHFPIWLNPASGIGIQPEFRYSLSDDQYQGVSVGATGWFNYLKYLKAGADGSRKPENPTISEFAASLGPTLSYVWELPTRTAYQQFTVGAEYVLAPTTDEYIVSLTGHKRGFGPYVCFRMGARW